MKILLIHSSIEVTNGAVAHALFLQKTFKAFNTHAEMIGIWHENGVYYADVLNGNRDSFTTFAALMDYVLEYCRASKFQLIHFHGVLQFELADILSNYYPTVFTLHNAQLSCVSGNKFYLNASKNCTHSVGPSCLLKAYTQRCAGTRHPFSLLKKYISKKREIKAANRLYKQIISPSIFYKNESVKHGIPPASIHHIPYPLTVNQHLYTRKNKPLNVLFSGRIDEMKGAHLLVELFKIVYKNGVQPVLNIAGEGYLKQTIQNDFKRQKLPIKVNFLGWVNQPTLYQLYADTDLVIIPSIYPDNFPVVCLEAMAFEKPVITFRVGGLPEMIENGHNGYVIQMGDTFSMGEKISYLLKNKTERLRMGKNGFQKYINNYTPEIIIPQILEVYKNLLSAA